MLNEKEIIELRKQALEKIIEVTDDRNDLSEDRRFGDTNFYLGYIYALLNVLTDKKELDI